MFILHQRGRQKPASVYFRKNRIMKRVVDRLFRRSEVGFQGQSSRNLQVKLVSITPAEEFSEHSALQSIVGEVWQDKKNYSGVLVQERLDGKVRSMNDHRDETNRLPEKVSQAAYLL